MSILNKLSKIQQTLKAPKNLYNSFGKYNYRNCEGILEAVKPHLTTNKCVLSLSDEIIECGGRIYVKAIAKITDVETNESYEVSAFARESEVKKGMDDSQITGATSSYARKYALNGLFLLDDTKDADDEKSLMNDHNQKQYEEKKQTKKVDQKDYRAELVEFCKQNKIDLNEVSQMHHLTRQSTQDEFKAVLEFIRGE